MTALADVMSTLFTALTPLFVSAIMGYALFRVLKYTLQIADLMNLEVQNELAVIEERRRKLILQR